MFFELIVNYERERKFFFLLKIDFLNFTTLDEVKIDCTRLKPYMKGM
jgi:hypothetical protein